MTEEDVHDIGMFGYVSSPAEYFGGNKFLAKVESAKARSIDNAKSLPGNATIREEYVSCGKPYCLCEHGPYYYANWRDNNTKKLKKKYIGSYFHAEKEIQNSTGKRH